jgi:hypothetical protein
MSYIYQQDDKPQHRKHDLPEGFIVLLQDKITRNDAVQYTVKPSHVVTSIKPSPVSKGHIFPVLS